MAFDFPSSPTQGQQFSPTAGVSYVYNGYAWDLLSGPTAAVVPTSIRTFTSGSGTYTPTAGTVYALVELVGGGGGGGGPASGTAGGSGGNTTFGTMTGGGGSGGQAAGFNATSGGVATGGDVNIDGGDGSACQPTDNVISTHGGDGGNSVFGGGAGSAYGANTPKAPSPNSGGGGAGACTSGTTTNGGDGGGAGGYCRKLVQNPTATAYSVGLAGTAGSGNATAGASGIIIVTEYGGSSAAPVTVPNIKTITTVGASTYTPSPGLVAAIVECVGGGAAGGGVTAATGYILNGGGGGAGGYSRRLLTAAQIGASQTVTIGAGGTGGFGNGNPGGTTSVGTLCIATGGTGGAGASTGASGGAGAGASVSGAVGDVTFPGNPGSAGFYCILASSGITTIIAHGNGGASVFGGAGLSALAGGGSAVSAPAATGAGSGGGGGSCNNTAASNATGGPGANGIVIITEFIQQGGAAAAALPGSKVLIQTQTVSSAVANVAFTIGIDSTYDEYEFRFYNVKPASETNIAIQISQDGGATWKTDATYVYAIRNGGSSGTPADATSAIVTSIAMGLTQAIASTTAPCRGIIRFALPSVSGPAHTFWFDNIGHSTANGFWWAVGTGGYNGAGATNAFNAVRFVGFSGANLTQGTFNLYGIKK